MSPRARAHSPQLVLFQSPRAHLPAHSRQSIATVASCTGWLQGLIPRAEVGAPVGAEVGLGSQFEDPAGLGSSQKSWSSSGLVWLGLAGAGPGLWVGMG